MTSGRQLVLIHDIEDEPEVTGGNTTTREAGKSRPTDTAVAETIAELRYRITFYDWLYHGVDDPAIADGEYDQLKRQLLNLEAAHPELYDAHSPTQRIGGAVRGDLETVVHPTPMLSLDNAFTQQHLQEWWDQCEAKLEGRQIRVTAELKIDGLPIRLTYRDAKLIGAATRGDGQYGEDVLHNARTIRNLPLRIAGGAPEDLDVRGEVYIPRSTLERINTEQIRRDRMVYATSRNAASATMRQHDPKVAAGRDLRIWIYAVTAESGRNQADSQSEALHRLGEWTLPVNPQRIHAESVGEVAAWYDSIIQRRDELEYDIDGIVVKVDSVTHQRRLGATDRMPHWAIAWKFAQEEATSLLERIELRVGRFGKITPIGHLKPAEIKEESVRRASLQNAEHVRRNDIREGDRILVQRAGDGIPQVLRTIGEDPKRDRPRFEMPEKCPACDGPVEYEDGEAHWCVNDDCPGRLPEQLIHMAGPEVLDIPGLGEQKCAELVRAGMVRNVADIYTLQTRDLERLRGFGRRSATRLVEAIEDSKNRSLDRILRSMQIHRMGTDIARALAERYGSVDEITGLTAEHLTTVEAVDAERAEAIVGAFATPRVQQTIETMRQHGVALATETAPEDDRDEPETKPERTREATQAWPMIGFNVLVTGKIRDMNHNQTHRAIRFMGGDIRTSLTKDTTLVVHGEKPGNVNIQAKNRKISRMHHSDFHKVLAIAVEARNEDWENQTD